MSFVPSDAFDFYHKERATKATTTGSGSGSGHETETETETDTDTETGASTEMETEQKRKAETEPKKYEWVQKTVLSQEEVRYPGGMGWQKG